MSIRIMNGGIFGGLLRIVKDSGVALSEKDEANLEMLESLPKNEWINLDDEGNPITKEQAANNLKDHLSRFNHIS